MIWEASRVPKQKWDLDIPKNPYSIWFDVSRRDNFTSCTSYPQRVVDQEV
jgi:hypothetical protein